MTTQHKDDYCINEKRITKLEAKIDEHEEDIEELDIKHNALEKRHHKDFVNFRNTMNNLQGELIAINSSIKTLITIVTLLGVIVAILEVIARYPPFH